MIEWLNNPIVVEMFQAVPLPMAMLLVAVAFKRQIAAAIDTHIRVVATIPKIEEAMAGIRDTMDMVAVALGKITSDVRKDVVLVVEDEVADQRLIEESLRGVCEGRGLRLVVVPSFKFAREDLLRTRIVIMDLCTPGCSDVEAVVALLHALRCRAIIVFTGRDGVKQIPGTILLKKGEDDSWERMRKFVEEHGADRKP